MTLRSWPRWIAAGALALAAASPARAQTAKESLKETLSDLEVAGNWIYDDIPAGFAQAQKSGKPLLVVFR